MSTKENIPLVTTSSTTTTTTTTPMKVVDKNNDTDGKQETVTTTTKTTTSTPVKLLESNSKVEETREITTTTTKITTILSPIKVEPKKHKIVNKVWNDKGPIKKQLFRDLDFGRYGPETKATEIHRDPERDYSQYNIQTIQRKVRETRLLVKAYHQGVWLDEDPDFLAGCQLHIAPTKEEKKGRVEEYKRWENFSSRVAMNLEDLFSDMTVSAGPTKK